MNKEKAIEMQHNIAMKLCLINCREETHRDHPEFIDELNAISDLEWCKKCSRWKAHMAEAKRLVSKNRDK